MGTKFYNGWSSTTLWAALASAVLTFAGTMLGWSPDQVKQLSDTLIPLVGAVAAGGVGAKVAAAIAEKKAAPKE